MLLAAVLWGIGIAQRLARRGTGDRGAVACGGDSSRPSRGMRSRRCRTHFSGISQAVAGSGAFTLFPWVGFLLVGVAIGMWLDRTRTDDRRTPCAAVMAVAGPAIAVGGYLSTYLPPVYADTTFWTGSPTYFFVRLGVLITAIPLAYAWNGLFTRLVSVCGISVWPRSSCTGSTWKWSTVWRASGSIRR